MIQHVGMFGNCIVQNVDKQNKDWITLQKLKEQL